MVGGGPALLITETGVGAMIEEGLHHVGLTIESRFHQRRESETTSALSGIRGSSAPEEEAGDGHRAGGGGGVERHHAHRVRRGLIDFGPMLQQVPNHGLMSEEAREAEGTEAVTRYGIREVGIGIEKRAHTVPLSKRGGLEDIERGHMAPEARHHVRLVVIRREENRRDAIAAGGGELRVRPHKRLDSGGISRRHRRPESRLVGHGHA